MEADVEVSVLVVAGVFSDSLASSQVPELDAVICTASQESIERIGVAICSFIELNCVGVALVTVIDDLNCLVHIGVIDDQLLVGAPEETNRRVSFDVMEAEGRNVLGAWVAVYLYQFK